MLSSLIIEECQKVDDFQTTYFYCREGDDTTATCKGVLRGLVAQVSLSLPRVDDILIKSICKCGREWMQVSH